MQPELDKSKDPGRILGPMSWSMRKRRFACHRELSVAATHGGHSLRGGFGNALGGRFENALGSVALVNALGGRFENALGSVAKCDHKLWASSNATATTTTTTTTTTTAGASTTKVWHKMMKAAVLTLALTCLNIGAVEAQCNPGYAGTGTSCSNINECAEGTHDCDTNARCADTDGSFTCTCNPGYAGTGTVTTGCFDVDECQQNGVCAAGEVCTNTDGSYLCVGADPCAGIEAVCVESDLATMRETRSIDALSQGCQCCIIANSDSESGPMDTCLHSLVPPVDFCVDPGGGMNNFAAATFECRHPCETGDWDSQFAAGCHGDGMGNAHDDQFCVVEQVWAPGEPYDSNAPGDTCCNWCGDFDGDGNPDYQGCCEGMRTDGEMGCEWLNCQFMCNGLECYLHEDQTACEGNGGTWTATHTCMDAIADQRGYVAELGDTSIAAAVWLGHHGASCCQMDADGTPYDPSVAGTCNDADVAVYVSV